LGDFLCLLFLCADILFPLRLVTEAVFYSKGL
jgi:hypothetical protein